MSQWLEQQFLPYLEEWESSVRSRPGYEGDKAAQKMMLLPLETRQGILITGTVLTKCLKSCSYFTVKSFIELVKFAFTIPGVTVMFSNKLCQDCLENFFGQQRQRGGTHENPNASQCLKNAQALRVINSTCRTIRGNCRGSKSGKSIMDSENAPLQRRSTSKKK